MFWGKADPQIAGLVIMAGPTRPLEDLVIEQTQYIISSEKDGASPTAKSKLEELREQAAKVKRLTQADGASTNLLLGAPAIYWLDLRRYDPIATAQTLKQSLLILQGQRDYQVTDADFAGWNAGAGRRRVFNSNFIGL